MRKPPQTLVLKMIFLDGIQETWRLPWWWYTAGARHTFGQLTQIVRESVKFFGVDVWGRNLFVPMYGDVSIAGRALSFTVRFVVLLFRLLGVVLVFMAVVILSVVYVVILPLAVFGFFTHLIGLMLSYA